MSVTNQKICAICSGIIKIDEPSVDDNPQALKVAQAATEAFAAPKTYHFECKVFDPCNQPHPKNLAYTLNGKIVELPARLDQEPQNSYNKKVMSAVTDVISSEKKGDSESTDSKLTALKTLVAPQPGDFWARSHAIKSRELGGSAKEFEIIKALLENGPIEFFTRSHVIAYSRIQQSASVQALLENGPILVKARGAALLKATTENRPDTVEVLLKYGRDDIPDINEAVNQHDRDSLLSRAVNVGSMDILNMLFNSGMIFSKAALNNCISSTLNIDILKFFLDKNLINDEIKDNAFIRAAKLNKLDVVEFLKPLISSQKTTKEAAALARYNNHYEMECAVLKK